MGLAPPLAPAAPEQFTPVSPSQTRRASRPVPGTGTWRRVRSARGQPRITIAIKGAAGPRGTDPTRCQTNVEASLTPGTATGYRANGIRPQNCFILCHCRILNVLPAAAAPSGEHQRQILLLGVIAGNAAAVHLALVVAGVAIKGVVAIRIRAP